MSCGVCSSSSGSILYWRGFRLASVPGYLDPLELSTTVLVYRTWPVNDQHYHFTYLLMRTICFPLNAPHAPLHSGFSVTAPRQLHSEVHASQGRERAHMLHLMGVLNLVAALLWTLCHGLGCAWDAVLVPCAVGVHGEGVPADVWCTRGVSDDRRTGFSAVRQLFGSSMHMVGNWWICLCHCFLGCQAFVAFSV